MPRTALAVLLLAAASFFAVPLTAQHLTYQSGPVLRHVKLYEVLWGSGTYVSGVAGGGTQTSTLMGDFLQDAVQSTAIDWLQEYDTPTTAIGRGTFAGVVAITPQVCATVPCTMDDTQVAAELERQINGGSLAAPDANTVYMVFLPMGVTVTLLGGSSCVSFCSYHNYAAYTNPFRYAVLPYIGAGSACQGACGGAANDFDNTTSGAWHQVGETITDPEVGTATGWTDNTNGEIGDICGQQQWTKAFNGTTFTFQKLWSNMHNVCFTQNPYQLGDVNADGSVSSTDIFYLVNSLFAGGAAPATFTGDVNTDGNVTSADIFYLVNYLFAAGPPPF